MEKIVKRSAVIKKLVNNDIKTIIDDFNNRDTSYASDIFAYGFKGYNNFSNKELQYEFKYIFLPDEDIIVIDG